MEKIKYFKIHKKHPNFISFDLIENNIVVGGYLIPDRGENKKNMIVFLKKEGYIEYEKILNHN